MRSRPVIAIDGPSGVGKSTVARHIAGMLGFVLVDTGALYRTLAWLADRDRVDWNNPDALADLCRAHRFEYRGTGELHLDNVPVGDEIRTPHISMGASQVAKHEAVRKALLEVQREMGRTGGVVLEGRDVGTAVFPDAEVKIFLTARPEERARRRYMELKDKGNSVTFEEVLEDQEARDEADSNRAVAPLRKAEDAALIECDSMTVDQVVAAIYEKIVTVFPLTSQ
jgi:CMP/dCMP kinase